MVLGIDIGGTKIGWACYPVENGTIGEQALSQGEAATPKGVRALDTAYSHIVETAIRQNPEYGLIAAGVCSPGNFIAQDEYGVKGYSAKQKALAENLPVPEPKMMGPGSAFNLWRKPGSDEFNSVALQSVFQRTMPYHVPVFVQNDAAAQMQGLAQGLMQNGSRSKIEGKRVMYIGPGTGLGTAVRAIDGSVAAYGRYQEMQLPPHAESGYDKALFDMVWRDKESKYRALGVTEPAIEPEDVLCGNALRIIIGTVLDEQAEATTDPAYLKHFDQRLKAGDDKAKQAVPYLRAVGHYMADMLIRLRDGDFHTMDCNREPNAEFKLAAKNFDTLLVGGGMSRAGFYQEIIRPAAMEALQEKGIFGNFAIIHPDHPELAATYAAACQASTEALAQTPEQLAQKPMDEQWRKKLQQLKPAGAIQI